MKNLLHRTASNYIILTICLCLVVGLAGGAWAKPVPEPVQTTRDLRNIILATDPKEISITPTSENPNVWGILMETGYPKALVTLVSLVDGTTSLYWGSGGGIIGGGGHESVRNASKKFIKLAELLYSKLTPAENYLFPDIGPLSSTFSPSTARLLLTWMKASWGPESMSFQSYFMLAMRLLVN